MIRMNGFSQVERVSDDRRVRSTDRGWGLIPERGLKSAEGEPGSGAGLEVAPRLILLGAIPVRKGSFTQQGRIIGSRKSGLIEDRHQDSTPEGKLDRLDAANHPSLVD